MSFVVPQIKLTWQVCWGFFMLPSRIRRCTCQGGLSLTITHFLHWLESPHCFLNRKSPCIPTNNKFPLGVLIILNTENLAGAELREAKTDVPGLGKKKGRMESWPLKSVEISIRQVWIGGLKWCETLQDTSSYIYSPQFWAHVIGYITSAWGDAIIRVSCLTSRVIVLFKLKQWIVRNKGSKRALPGSPGRSAFFFSAIQPAAGVKWGVCNGENEWKHDWTGSDCLTQL